MKIQIKPLARILCVGLLLAGSAALITGCASTPTSESTGEYFDDSSITAKIKTAYATDPDVSALRVKVNTYKGIVQLSGFVNTAAEKTKAEQIAQGVKGVKEVRNGIAVK